jgi:peptidoglycan/xylan/chitin deacetylase (PgdA/CDA1 family)
VIAKGLGLIIVMAALALSGCGDGSAPPPAAQQAPAGNAAAPNATAPATTSTPPPDPKAFAANELGDVPVLMYHRIVAQPASVYDRTPADFQAELERLAGERYVTITAGDHTAGRIDIPAGTHPVVLTFDDGDPTQFSLTPQGLPVPGTAVAIMRDVATRHPEFRGVGTFYVNGDPFGDPGGKKTLPWLHNHGMEVGNHTLTHVNLRQAGPEAAQRDISRGDQAIRQAVPGAEPATIALPFGIHPRDAALAQAGSGEGGAYRYRGVFLVGANPSPSPYAADFDALRIPRIRSQAASGKEAQFGSTAWLDKLAAAPDTRYTSDGVPTQIAYPSSREGTIAAAYRAKARSY